MRPKQYNDWYATQRGAWIGDEEYRLVASMLAPRPGETLLDVGCGTGYFTRRFEAGVGSVIGTDIDLDMLRFAAGHSAQGIGLVASDARRLPFRDGSFDLVVSITALCFIREEKQVLREMLRVSRRRVVLGLLNRHSILYLQKGLCGGKGAYRGARWHTPKEATRLFSGLEENRVKCRTAIVFPGGKSWSRQMEPRLRRWLSGYGAFIAVTVM